MNGLQWETAEEMKKNWHRESEIFEKEKISLNRN